MVPRMQRMTPIQLQMLVDILSENPELISGQLSPNFTRVDRKQKWQAVATLLNSKELGPQKDADRWRKSWTDLKFAIRSKAAKIELAGGSDLLCEKLSNLEKRVLQMIGEVSIESVDNDEAEVLTSKLQNIKKEQDLSKTNVKKPVFRISLNNIPEISTGENSDKADGEEDNNDDDSCRYDEDDSENESPKHMSNESFSSLKKRRKISSDDKSDSELIIEALQKQNVAIKEQTNILKDIAKSLQYIAKALQKR